MLTFSISLGERTTALVTLTSDGYLHDQIIFAHNFELTFFVNMEIR